MFYYIEMVILNNICISLLSNELATNFSLQKVNMKQYILVLILEQICFIISLFMNVSCYFISYLIYFYLYRNTMKKMMMYYSIRYVLFLIEYILFGGTFYMANYFVDASISLYIWCILSMVMSVMLHYKWNTYIDKKVFVYSITMYGEHTIKLKGYLDSANLCVYKGVPVLFVDTSYEKYFIDENKEIYEFYDIGKEYTTFIYFIEVLIRGSKREWVYICFNKKLDLPYGCKCLLNIEM